METYHCKYCGQKIPYTHDEMCSTCRNKLPLVRKLITVGNLLKSGLNPMDYRQYYNHK